MTKCNPNETIQIMAIDLSKNSFQLHGVDRQGRKIMGKKLTRKKTFEFMAKLEPCTVVMEACGSAHYWARLFQMYGHQTKLIAPQFVKPFVKSNKNDAADAAAIAEAAQRPDMRFVAIKSIEQQDNQCIHRIRSQAVRNRTSLINQIRGLLLEYGVDIPKGRAKVREQLPHILEDAENGLSHRFRFLLADLQDELIYLDARVAKYNKEIENMVNNCELAKQLLTIPGIGPQTATALLACIGNINMFKSGREMAAFFGLVPRQHSTGGKPTLLGISKRGDVYIRTLLVHGARSVLQKVAKKQDRMSLWANGLIQRRGMNIAAIAMANKMLRIAYALLSKGEKYKLLEPAV